jgi:hypothetical protein
VALPDVDLCAAAVAVEQHDHGAALDGPAFDDTAVSELAGETVVGLVGEAVPSRPLALNFWTIVVVMVCASRAGG